MADDAELQSLIDEVEFSPESLTTLVSYSNKRDMHAKLVELGAIEKLRDIIADQGAEAATVANAAIALWNMAIEEVCLTGL
jgi:hypothetical protein